MRVDPRFCDVPHTSKTNGVWVQGQETRIEVVTAVNGITTVKLRCDNCHLLTGALPKEVVWEWLNPFGPMVMRSHNATETCVVQGCDSNLIEWHHFAPRNTFRDEADSWPILPLCRTHHVEWHTRMNGYRWHRIGGAA